MLGLLDNQPLTHPLRQLSWPSWASFTNNQPRASFTTNQPFTSFLYNQPASQPLTPFGSMLGISRSASVLNEPLESTRPATRKEQPWCRILANCEMAAVA